MTSAVSSALQVAIYQTLIADANLNAQVGNDIYDALPTGTLPDTYVSLGPEEVKDASDQTKQAARHDFVVSVVTSVSGFQTAKDIAANICDALVGANLTLSRGILIGLWFVQSKAARTDNATSRRIDLTFRARVEDS